MSQIEENINNKLPINGLFSNDELKNKFNNRTSPYKQKYFIEDHPGFEVVELPNGQLAKLAYGKTYTVSKPDIDIETEHIGKYESLSKSTNSKKKKAAKEKLKFHYKRTISLISDEYKGGWNRWSENILDLFLSEKTNKVLWGSGNCGKSAVMALLLYIKWRVRPDGRMVIVVSKVVADASARVFGYIKKIHTKAPVSERYDLHMVDNQKEKAIYCLMEDEKTGKMVKNDLACMINLPAKVSAKSADIGSNLLGKHPSDRLILAFDESQELPGTMLGMKIFMNWMTNEDLDIYAWGNPSPINFYSKEDHDLLFKLGADKLTLEGLRDREKKSKKTFSWTHSDTEILHLSMLDSPKDDPEEKYNYIIRADGSKKLRLHFLAGATQVQNIAENNSPNSPEWYSQVLGFPFIDTTGTREKGVLTPYIVKTSKTYPLIWKDQDSQLEWFMGVDPSTSGHGDDCAIVIG